MNALEPLLARLRSVAERVDRLSLRERMLVFGASVVVAYVAWQALLMDPLAARAAAAGQRIAEVQARTEQLDATTAAGDPRVQAIERKHALETRLAELDTQLREAAGGYVPPERMADLLRDVLAGQRGLRLVSLRNLPVESLASPVRSAAPGTSGSAAPPASNGEPDAHDVSGAAVPVDAGPFVHPVEVVVDGDYASVVAYLHALEALPWRVQWRRLDVAAGGYPQNRVRIELATLGLARTWLSV